MSIPQTQKALVIPGPLEPFTLTTRPVPTPGDDDVLVKVESTGLNPAENHVRTEAAKWVLSEYPALVGTDGAGVIVALGKNVTGFEVGDRILFQGWFTSDRSTYQQYALVHADRMAKVPPGISLAQASSIPLALCTAAFGLALPVNREPRGLGGAGIKPFWEDGAKNAYKNKPILIFGGSSAVGQFAIQIASYMGFSPIVTTASAHNASYLTDLGATHFVDRNANVTTALKDILPDTAIDVIFDTVHTPISQTEVNLLSPGGVIPTIWPLPEGKDALDLSGDRVATYFYGSVHLHKELGVAMYARLTEFLEKGIIKPVRIQKLPNGLAGIESGLGRLDRREVSGVKLVVSPSETP